MPFGPQIPAVSFPWVSLAAFLSLHLSFGGSRARPAVLEQVVVPALGGGARMVSAGCKRSARIHPWKSGKKEPLGGFSGKEEPLNEVLCAMEGLGPLGWVRFGFLVVWWLLLPCPHGLKKSVLSSDILGFFRDLVKGNEFHRHPQRLLQRG